MIDLSKHKLKLEYPCKWCYKIVVKSNSNGKNIAKEIFKEKEHKIQSSKTSSNGKFKSYSIETIVDNENERTYLHKQLSEHKNIHMVI